MALYSSGMHNNKIPFILLSLKTEQYIQEDTWGYWKELDVCVYGFRNIDNSSQNKADEMFSTLHIKITLLKTVC